MNNIWWERESFDSQDSASTPTNDDRPPPGSVAKTLPEPRYLPVLAHRFSQKHLICIGIRKCLFDIFREESLRH